MCAVKWVCWYYSFKNLLYLGRVVKLVGTTDLKSPLSNLFLIRDVGAELEMARVFRALVQMAPTALWLVGVM